MLVCLLALSVGQAAAQRCLPGMQAVEMRGGMAPSAGYFAGLGVTTHAKGRQQMGVRCGIPLPEA